MNSQEILEEIAKTSINGGFSFNRTQDYFKISLILSKIYPTKSFKPLIEYIKSEFESFNNKNKNEYYFPKNIIKKLEYLETESEYTVNELKRLFQEQPDNKFNWNNFDKLVQYNELNLLSEFCTDFRGNIINIHNVYDKYVIIESDEKNTKHFYVKTINGNLSIHWHETFEHALIYAIFNESNYADSCVALYKFQNQK